MKDLTTKEGRIAEMEKLENSFLTVIFKYKQNDKRKRRNKNL